MGPTCHAPWASRRVLYSSSDMMNLDAILKRTVEIATNAGELLLRRYEALEAKDVEHKGATDLVTVADRESEQAIVSCLREEFPDHSIVAEEGGGTRRSSPYLWHVDPLDGTINFVHGLPVFAVSMALYQGPEPLVAVVHAPALRETFHASRGGGAYLGRRRLRTSGCDSMMDAFLVTGFACVRDREQANNLDNFSRIIQKCQGIRRLGSAALDLAYVAAGRFDGFWELRLSSWDLAAGALLVREAGGMVTDFSGGDDWLTGGHIVATNGPIHQQVMELLDPPRSKNDKS